MEFYLILGSTEVGVFNRKGGVSDQRGKEYHMQVVKNVLSKDDYP